jgi:nicotinate-nucleotide adenylyltransferase
MVRLAIGDVPSLEASAVELSRSGPSYTIETLRFFHDRFGPECAVHFIIGFDAFSEIHTWKEYKKLFPAANFIVTARSGTHLRDLQRIIQTHVSAEYYYDKAAKRFLHPEWLPIFSTAVTRFDVSGTQIRNHVAAGRSVTFLVPRTVEDYIYGRKLYVKEAD